MNIYCFISWIFDTSISIHTLWICYFFQIYRGKSLNLATLLGWLKQLVWLQTPIQLLSSMVSAVLRKVPNF